MHPRNLYNKKPDFGELATIRPTLRPYLIPKSKKQQITDDQQQSAEVSPSHPRPCLLPTSSDAITLSSSSGLDQEKKYEQHHKAAAIKTPASFSTDTDLAEQLQERPSTSTKKFAYTLDFSDPEALRELTCAVLERDFGLKVEIPLDKLIPAVPQRLNYVHWIEDLLMCCEAGGSKQSQRGDESKSADSAVRKVGVAFDNADSAISGASQMEVEDVTHSDCADSTVCVREGEVEEGVACYQKGGVAFDCADDMTVQVPKGDSIIGVDIGTGASCIYPLLATSLNGWRFLATEIDDEAVKFARDNVSRNNLEQKIEASTAVVDYTDIPLKIIWKPSYLKQVSPSTILSGAIDDAVRYSFCMCNPPFFKDREERYGGGATTRSELRPPPGTFSSGTLGETVTEGGEVEFVRKIVHDSLALRDRVRWYSSMLGKKSSVKQVLSELNQHKVPVTTTTEFVQGKTWRWGVAWSFDETIKEKVARLSKPLSKKPTKRQQPLVLTLPKDTAASDVRESFVKAREWFLEQLTQLKIDYTTTNEPSVAERGEREEREERGGSESSSSMVLGLHCVAKRNTWSHQRRRRRLMEKLQAQQSSAVTHGTNGDTSESSSRLEDASRAPSSPLRARDDAAEADEIQRRKEINQEIESLSPPCRLEFHCSLLLIEHPGGSSTDGDSPHKTAPTHSQVAQGGATVAATAVKKAKLQCRDHVHVSDKNRSPCSKSGNVSTVDGGGREPGSKVKGRKRSRRKGGASGGRSRDSAVITVVGGGLDSPEQLLCVEFEWISGDDKDMLHQIVQYFRNKCQNMKF